MRDTVPYRCRCRDDKSPCKRYKVGCSLNKVGCNLNWKASCYRLITSQLQECQILFVIRWFPISYEGAFGCFCPFPLSGKRGKEKQKFYYKKYFLFSEEKSIRTLVSLAWIVTPDIPLYGRLLGSSRLCPGGWKMKRGIFWRRLWLIYP